MKIEQSDNTIKVFTPYNPSFVLDIKRAASGRWNSVEKCWEYPAEARPTIAKIMNSYFGYVDGSAEDTVTVDITVTDEEIGRQSGVYILGREICRATGRDSGARMSDGCVLISGGIKSGGSVKNWCTILEEGSVVRIINVPREALDLLVYPHKIVEPSAVDVKVKLLEEKVKLELRLAEIEKLIMEAV